MQRRKSREIYAGSLKIGGGAPVSVQSMTNADPHDFPALLAQVKALEAAGCQLVRLAVPDAQAARVFGKIKEHTAVPLCADIHFDYKMALEAVAAGADKLRINPGNIGVPERVKAVAEACAARRVPIRIGVNSGSLDADLLEKYGSPTAGALAESAIRQAAMLEGFGFGDICISVKASDVPRTMAATLKVAGQTDYPLHLGVTEAGIGEDAVIRSAAGIGGLLAMGIGDTVRVSLTGDPVSEVQAAKRILAAAGVALPGFNVVSCPTCGRTRVSLERAVRELKAELEKYAPRGPVTVAVMGCAVNGPGEAREADAGIAGGEGKWLLFAGGQKIGAVAEADAVGALIALLKERNLLGDRK